MGLKTFPEHGPESRSDAHAWASHLLYHLLASVAGVRPAESGFRSVRIEPAPGGLGRFAAKVCHPRVLIRVEWKVTDTAEGSGGTFVVSLPSNLSGVFAWDGEEWPLRPGVSRIQVDAKAMQSFSRDRTTADGTGVPGGGGAASNGSYNRELGR